VLSHGGKFSFVEGQAVGLIVQDKVCTHNICSCCKGDTGYSDSISICVQDKDEQTKTICELKAEEEICITGPIGTDCVIPKDPKANVIMMASGLGVAHFRSFLEKWFTDTEVKYQGQAWMFYDDKTLYAEELEQLKQKSDNHFRYECSENLKDNICKSGDEVWKLLQEPNTHVYLCGVKEMEAGVTEALSEIASKNK
jgi:ferredoxin--NADP+ reductase